MPMCHGSAGLAVHNGLEKWRGKPDRVCDKFMAEAFFTPLFSKEGVGEICGRINILMLLLKIPPAPPFQRGDKSL
jgi:hypothetical protein